MMRFWLILVCLIPLFSWSQEDTTVVEVDSVVREPDFVPIRINGEWTWFDIINEKASDSIRISDFADQGSGFYSAFVVKDSTHWGILDSSSDMLCPFAYDSILYIDNHLITKFNNEWSYHFKTDQGGDSLIQVSLDSVYFDNQDVYLFNNGKIGLILKNGTLIQPKYDGIHEISCSSKREGYGRYFMSLSGNNYNLLNASGEELLPEGVWDLRCTEDGVFEFKRGQYAEFYSPDLKEFVEPSGRDIIFYTNRGYKIYNEDNSKGELHLADGRIFKDQYDDYFLLENHYIAVRRDGKIALTQNGIDLLSEFKYDQINPIEKPVNSNDTLRFYFKFYIDDACGLMDQNGNELFDAAYANIFTTPVNSRFIVLNNELTGIVDDKGKTIIPTKYQEILLDKGTKLFVVIHHNRMGLFDFDGRMKMAVEYNGYDVLANYGAGEQTEGLLVLQKQKKYFFVNSKGLIDPSGFDHYNFSNNVLKTYGYKYITVFLFDQNGAIEERSNYPIYRNAVVKGYFNDDWRISGGWKVSELEENQKEGYFGLRYYKQQGLCVRPQYRAIRPVSFSDYLGRVTVSNEKYPITDDIDAEVVSGHHHLETGAGKTDSTAYFSSELAIMRFGSGNRFVNRTPEGKQRHAYSNIIGEGFLDFSLKIHYSDLTDDQHHYRRYFRGGEVKICPIEEAEVSFFEYFRYLNSTDGLRVAPSVMKDILNPKLGVRFENSDCDVLDASHGYHDGEVHSYKSPQTFEEYFFVSGSVFFERAEGESLGRLRFRNLPKDGREEVSVDDVISVESLEPPINNFGKKYLLTSVRKNRLAKIHVDYPAYFFYLDSINLSYEAGRITRKIDSNTVRLLDPTGRIIADSCILVRYLNEERFGIFRKNGWQLIDKNGTQISSELYTRVSEFKRNRAEFSLADGTAVVIDKNGQKLKSLPEPRIYLDQDHFYVASAKNQIVNVYSQQSDEARGGEKYLSRGFFVSTEDGNTLVRRFGTSNVVSLKSDSKLKLFGSCAYFERGKHIYSVDSNLVITKHKKVDRFREVTPEIGWLEGKRDHLIDADWHEVCKMNKDQRFEMRNGDLVVLAGDSVFQNFGSLKPTKINPETGVALEKINVFSEGGKYGAKRGNDTILPLNYSWLSRINDEEFLTRTDSELMLFDGNLNQMVNRPFDRFLRTNAENWVFFNQGEVYVGLKEGGEYKFVN